MFGRLSDKQAVERVLAGDRGAFRAIVERYGGSVYGIAYAHLGNRAEAEEVEQDAFLRTFESLDRLRGTAHLGGWLATVARNRARDLLRRRTREERAAEQLAQAASAPVPTPEREELRRLVREHIDALDDDTREILVLHYYFRRPQREIATDLGISRVAVAKRLERARTALGRRLVNALGPDLETEEKHRPRTERTMGLVLAARVPWSPGTLVPAPASTALGGAAAVKAGAALVAVFALGLALWGYWQREEAVDAPPRAPLPVAAPEVPAPAEPAGAPEAPSAETLPPDAAAADAEAPAVAAGEVQGIALDEQGRPVPGVPVYVERASMLLDIDKPVEPFRAQAVSDGKGRFTFKRVPIQARPRGFWSNVYRLRVFARGDGAYAWAHIDGGEWNSLPGVAFVKLVLLPTETLAGTAIDEAGKPVAGARVRADAYEGAAYARSERPDSVAAVTGSDGRFELEGLWPGSYPVQVHAPGFAPKTSPAVRTGTEDFRIELSRAATVSGRVVDIRSGAPAVGAEVAAWDDPTMVSQRCCVTDDTGAFTIGGFDAGSYTLGLQDGPYQLVGKPHPITLDGKVHLKGVVLQAERGAAAAGRVVDAETRRPLAGVPVMVQDHGFRECLTDAEGRYRLEGLPAGRTHIRLLVPNLLPDHAWKTVELQAGRELTGVDIVVGRSPLLRGRVIDASGQPLPGARVLLTDGEGERASHAVCDGEGRFAWSSGDDASGLRLQAFHETGVSEVAGPAAPAANGTQEFVLRVRPAVHVLGTVTDSAGRALAGVRIDATPALDTAALFPRETTAKGPMFYEETPRRMLGLEDTTCAGGRFHLGPLLPGAYTVRAYRLGRGNGPFAEVPLQVTAGKDIDNFSVVMPGAAGGAVEGSVRLGGQPLMGQLVQVFFLSTRNEQRSGADGHYRVDGVPAGEAKAVVRYGLAVGGTRVTRELTARVAVADGQVTPVGFDFEAGNAAIEGSVTINREFNRAYLFLVRSDLPEGERVSITADLQGHYRAEGLPAGPYTVTMNCGQAPGVAPVKREIDVTLQDGQTARCDFLLSVGDVGLAVWGIRDGEQAHVMALPGRVEVPATLTSEWFRALAPPNKPLETNGCSRDGERLTLRLDPGTYTLLGLIEVQGAEPGTPPTLRHASAVVEVAAGGVTSAELTIP